MSPKGLRIAMHGILQRHRRTAMRLQSKIVPPASSAAAPGTSSQGSCARPTATASPLTSETAVSASGLSGPLPLESWFLSFLKRGQGRSPLSRILGGKDANVRKRQPTGQPGPGAGLPIPRLACTNPVTLPYDRGRGHDLQHHLNEKRAGGGDP